MVYVSLWDLPEKSTYLKLNNEYSDFIIATIKNLSSINDVSKAMNISKAYFYRLNSNKKINLDFLNKLCNLFNFDKEELSKNVILIVSGKNNNIGIKNPKFPFKFDNKEGGILFGAALGDGWISKLGDVLYCNVSEKLVDNLIKNTKKIFGVVYYKKIVRNNKYVQVRFPKIVGDCLKLFNLKEGYKSETDTFIDLSIFSDKMKYSFLTQLWDDEGNVRLSDRRLQIKQTRNLKIHDKQKIRKNVYGFCPRILKEIQKTLQGFGIHSTLSLESIRKKDTIKGDFAINIYGKENLVRFQEKINFNLDYKSKLLNKCIKSYKFPSAPRNKRLEFALEKAKTVEEKEGHITKESLSAEAKRSIKTATYYIVELIKKNKLERIGTNRYKIISLP